VETGFGFAQLILEPLDRALRFLSCVLTAISVVHPQEVPNLPDLFQALDLLDAGLNGRLYCRVGHDDDSAVCASSSVSFWMTDAMLTLLSPVKAPPIPASTGPVRHLHANVTAADEVFHRLDGHLKYTASR
jgi:hypothetical protein